MHQTGTEHTYTHQKSSRWPKTQHIHVLETLGLALEVPSSAALLVTRVGETCGVLDLELVELRVELPNVLVNLAGTAVGRERAMRFRSVSAYASVMPC